MEKLVIEVDKEQAEHIFDGLHLLLRDKLAKVAEYTRGQEGGLAMEAEGEVEEVEKLIKAVDWDEVEEERGQND